MKPIETYAQVRVAPGYMAYVVEQDNAVVFYNAEDPFLLEGTEGVQLISNMQAPKEAARPASIETHLFPVLAKLLMEGFVVYVDTNE